MLKRILSKILPVKKIKQTDIKFAMPDEVVEAFAQIGDELRYPPAEKGFPAKVPGYALLSLQSEVISKIKRELQIRDSEFNVFVIPLLENFANFVHLLPASEYHHHRAQGGLLRHTLEVVLFSIKIAKSIEFDANEMPVIKSDRALAWRLAVVVGSVMHDIGKPISDVDIWDASGTKQWMPAVNHINDWANDNDIERYFIVWRPDRHERHHNSSLTKMTDIVPRDLLSFITKEGNDIYNELTEALAGSNSARAQSSRNETGSVHKNKIHKVISTADSASVTTDLKLHSGDAVRAARTGVPLLARVVDAMRLLVKRGDWQTNKAGSPVWYTTEGVFIVWGSAIDSITTIVRESGVGVPHSADSLADIMLSFGLCVLNENDSVYWRMAPHLLNDKAHRESKEPKNALSCLRLSDPVILFVDDAMPLPASCRIKVGDAWVEFLASGTRGKLRESQPYVGSAPGDKVNSNIDPDILKGGSLPMGEDLPSDGTVIKRGEKPKDLIEHMLRINLLSPDAAKAIRERDEKERVYKEAKSETGLIAERDDTVSQVSSVDTTNENSEQVQNTPPEVTSARPPARESQNSQGSLFESYPVEPDSRDEVDLANYYHEVDLSELQSSPPPTDNKVTMTFKERLELAAIEQGYREGELNIRQEEQVEPVDLWAKARQTIRNHQDVADGHVVAQHEGETTGDDHLDMNCNYSEMYREAPTQAKSVFKKLILERQKELIADNYRLFIQRKDENDTAVYETLSAAGFVWKTFLEPTEQFQMYKSKPGYFLKRGLNEDINLISCGVYYKNTLPMNPAEIFFNEADVSRAIATYGIVKKTYENLSVVAISGSALRSMARSLEMDIATLKFIICFYFDSIHKRGSEHVFVDNRIQNFMVTSDE